MKIGFIGYGSMGSMIINGLLSKNVLDKDNIIISTRTTNKLDDFKNQFPQIEIAESNITLAKKADKIFLFVTTGEVLNVIKEIQDFISSNIHIIYISAGLSLDIMEKKFRGKITRVIPSLTSEVNEGVSLITHNENVSDSEKKFVEDIFSHISKVKTLTENDLEVGTILTSCAPAFIAFMMSKFAEMGIKNSNLSKKEAEDLVNQTLYGTARLMVEKDMSLEEVVSRVATKGGITEEGIKVLENGLPPVFDQLFIETHKKHDMVERHLKKEFLG